MGSPEGRVLILEFVGAGSIVGLAENISGIPYEKTAASTEVTNASFLPRRFSHVVAGRRTARLRSRGIAQSAIPQGSGRTETTACRIRSPETRGFVLGLSFTQKEDRTYIRLPGASQEDLARMIGISRETASRMLSGSRRAISCTGRIPRCHPGFASFGENRKRRAGKTADERGQAAVGGR